MEDNQKLLKEYSDTEKGAYLGAIASLAMADHSASDEEIGYIGHLSDSADISGSQKQAVIRAATELSEEELMRCLDILKSSELRFSLVTDLISFSQSDSNYADEEKKSVEKIAEYLDIRPEQFSLLDQFVKKSATAAPQPPEIDKPGFLASLGLEDKFKQAGIDWKKFGKGLLGIAGPVLLANLISGRNNNRNLAGGSLFNKPAGGGIGSMISSLSGGRGFGKIGGFLSKLLGVTR